MAIPFEAKAKVQLCETKLVQWKKRAKINKTKEHKNCFFGIRFFLLSIKINVYRIMKPRETNILSLMHALVAGGD